MNSSSDESSGSSLNSSNDSQTMSNLISAHPDNIPQPEISLDNNNLNSLLNLNNVNANLNPNFNVNPSIANAGIDQMLHQQINPRTSLTFFTIPFIIFLLINSICLIHSFLITFNQTSTSYSFTLWCIIQKGQYYRMLTHHFYHFSLFHFIFTMIALYYLSKRLENQIGSIYTFILTIQSLILISLLNLLIIFPLKIGHLSTLDSNFWSQTGFTSVCLCLHQFYYLLHSNRNKTINLMLFDINAKHSALVFILLLQIIAPRLSIIGHVSGYITANLMYNCLVYVSFPEKEWIKELEEGCRRCGSIIRGIVVYVPIDEFNEEGVNEINCFFNFESGVKMIKTFFEGLINRKTNRVEGNNSNSNGIGNDNGRTESVNGDNERHQGGNQNNTGGNNPNIEMANVERLD